MPPLSYDSGLAGPQRTLVRDAVISRLAPLLRANGGFLRSVKSLPRPLKGTDPDELGMIASQINGPTPVVLVAIGKRELAAVNTDALSWRGNLQVAVYIVGGNARALIDGRLAGDATAATDSTADPGIDAMLEQVAQLLLGQDLAIPTVAEMRMDLEDEYYTFAEYSVWEQHYTAEVQLEINPNRAITDVVTEIDNLNEAVYPGGTVGDPTNPVVETLTELEAPAP